jgi:DNA-binding HxlR family transcriptional regulator
MRVLDLLGRRWALRALWELRDGPRTFRALREACDDVSPSSLNHRLADLRALGVVALGDDGYALSRPGAQLNRILLELHRWSESALGKPARAARPARRVARKRSPPAGSRQRR